MAIQSTIYTLTAGDSAVSLSLSLSWVFLLLFLEISDNSSSLVTQHNSRSGTQRVGFTSDTVQAGTMWLSLVTRLSLEDECSPHMAEFI